MEYIGCYFDYNKNTLLHLPSLNDINNCKYDINSIIVRILWETFNIHISDEYLFLSNPVNINISGTFEKQLSPCKFLIFNKTGLTIDVFLKEKSGIIFSLIHTEQLYKFCIFTLGSHKKSNDDYKVVPLCNPSCFSSNIFSIQTHNNIDFETSSIISEIEDENYVKMNPIKDVIVSTTVNKLNTVMIKPITSDLSTDKSLLPRDLFVDELKEKLKNRKIE